MLYTIAAIAILLVLSPFILLAAAMVAIAVVFLVIPSGLAIWAGLSFGLPAAILTFLAVGFIEIAAHGIFLNRARANRRAIIAH